MLIVALAAVAVVVVALMVVAMLARRAIRKRRTTRLGPRRLLLEAQLELLGEGPERALVRLRLQLDEATTTLGTSRAIAGPEPIGDLRLINQQTQASAARVAAVLDDLIGLRVTRVSKPAVDLLREQVRHIEALADTLNESALRSASTMTTMELEELTDSLRDHLSYLDAYDDALRSLNRGVTYDPENQQ